MIKIPKERPFWMAATLIILLLGMFGLVFRHTFQVIHRDLESYQNSRNSISTIFLEQTNPVDADILK